MKIDKEFTITGIEVRNDKLRPTIYGKGMQKKITIDWILSKKNIQLAFCIKTLLQHYFDSEVICMDNIDEKLFEKMLNGHYLSDTYTNYKVNTVHYSNNYVIDSPLMETLLQDKLKEYEAGIDNKSYSKSKITIGTYRKYKTSITYHLIPNFGKYKIHEMRSIFVIEWIKTLKIQIDTFKDYIIPLLAVYKSARSHKYITNDHDIFADDIIIKYAERTLPEGDIRSSTFTHDDLAKIMSSPDHYMKNLVLFGCFTGLRIGEIINLRIIDINFTDNLINVHSQTTSGVTDAALKSIDSVRKVKVLKVANNAIMKQLAICAAHKQDEFLFFNPNTSKQWSSSSKVNKHLTDYLDLLEISHKTCHDMRHTYASLLIPTENLYWIANQLGHADIELLIKTYGHWIPNSKIKGGYELNNAELEIYQPTIDMD